MNWGACGWRHAAGALMIAAVAVLPLWAACSPAQAQTQVQSWPQRPVKFVLPFGAGSATDVAARLMTDKLQAKWGQPVIIENKPGADGLLAINAFLQANDDHTLLYSSSASFMAHPYTLAKVPYNFERDMTPIARVTDTVLTVNVPASSANRTLNEFVAEAMARPGKLNVTGAPGVPDFTLDYFIKTRGLKVQKIPFKNIVEAATALAGNQIDFLLTSAAIVQPLANAGKIRIVAVTSRERASFAPDIPTVHELGFGGLAVETTAGFYGPKDMPLALREKIARDVIEVVSDKAITDRLLATGQLVRPGGPAELAATIKEQSELTTHIAKALELKPKN
ncbi:tripartite tricarboxylate transporter substrate binding protein [Pseudorhodoplanes sp.]|uniref:Bug family tripartite tricarboxylate transporter substrate binding protein n=1 Tax=Pseudorhodoplanes sp. TaxID=1934341 RepID=UPI002BE7670A|nr:tripartite tricarboxylate transporter substrate binding protein [Pseudorhodoplanes sp.]HWV40650.1 tripartite tricarboxylate transporter substrate binding protein [Pseudorhodoplanes sp.]